MSTSASCAQKHSTSGALLAPSLKTLSCFAPQHPLQRISTPYIGCGEGSLRARECGWRNWRRRKLAPHIITAEHELSRQLGTTVPHDVCAGWPRGQPRVLGRTACKACVSGGRRRVRRPCGAVVRTLAIRQRGAWRRGECNICAFSSIKHENELMRLSSAGSPAQWRVRWPQCRRRCGRLLLFWNTSVLDPALQNTVSWCQTTSLAAINTWTP